LFFSLFIEIIPSYFLPQMSIEVDEGSSAFQSQTSSSRSATPALSAPSKKPSSKVTERHFTPRTRRLAIASKSHIRTRIVYHEAGPFNPVNSRLARLEFAWATVKESANNSSDRDMKEAFRRASKSDIIKKNLLTFVSHI
jgi:hypothetical protein